MRNVTEYQSSVMFDTRSSDFKALKNTFNSVYCVTNIFIA